VDSVKAIAKFKKNQQRTEELISSIQADELKKRRNLKQVKIINKAKEIVKAKKIDIEESEPVSSNYSLSVNTEIKNNEQNEVSFSQVEKFKKDTSALPKFLRDNLGHFLGRTVFPSDSEDYFNRAIDGLLQTKKMVEINNVINPQNWSIKSLLNRATKEGVPKPRIQLDVGETPLGDLYIVWRPCIFGDDGKTLSREQYFHQLISEDSETGDFLNPPMTDVLKTSDEFDPSILFYSRYANVLKTEQIGNEALRFAALLVLKDKWNEVLNDLEKTCEIVNRPILNISTENRRSMTWSITTKPYQI
jgi:hypothetical protein